MEITVSKFPLIELLFKFCQMYFLSIDVLLLDFLCDIAFTILLVADGEELGFLCDLC